ncbi:MAG: iron donor protein CyaY [Leptothrix ochracea]|uniref:iron donor protein CyaY n=1 Tax=Leptothrix ochracea TaxID=735331 RepID=UPI0034E1A47B
MTTNLSDAEYLALATKTLTHVEATIDAWLDADVIDIDTHRTGGLLELSFPNGSKMVLNMQPPLHELWLAAQAGGSHYKYADGRWCDTRTGAEFFAVLSQQASRQAGQPLAWPPLSLF